MEASRGCTGRAHPTLDFLNHLDFLARRRILEQLCQRDVISLRATSRAGKQFCEQSAPHPLYATWFAPTPSHMASLLDCASKLRRCEAMAVSVIGGSAVAGAALTDALVHEAATDRAPLEHMQHLVLHFDASASPRVVAELRNAPHRPPAAHTPQREAGPPKGPWRVGGAEDWPFAAYTLFAASYRSGGSGIGPPLAPALLSAELAAAVARLFPRLQSLELHGHWGLAAPLAHTDAAHGVYAHADVADTTPAPDVADTTHAPLPPVLQAQPSAAAGRSPQPPPPPPLALLAAGLPRLRQLALPASLCDSPDAVEASGLSRLGLAAAQDPGSGSGAGSASSSTGSSPCQLEELVVVSDPTQQVQRTRLGWAAALVTALPRLRRLALIGGCSRLEQLLLLPRPGPSGVRLEELCLEQHLAFTPEPLKVRGCGAATYAQGAKAAPVGCAPARGRIYREGRVASGLPLSRTRSRCRQDTAIVQAKRHTYHNSRIG